MICKGCGKDKTLEEYHLHPHNKTGRFGNSKYTYFYELTKGDEYQEGKIRAHNKDKAIQIIKMRFLGWKIEKLCTFNAMVRARKGSRG